MIAERFPGIATLPVEEKRLLLDELCRDLGELDAEQPDPNIIEILEQRWKEYEAHPSTAMTLEEFRKRLGKG